MTVLLLGRHLELGQYRAEFLRAHGVEVVFPDSRGAAQKAIERGGFDAVVLSYTLSNETAQELLELIEQSCPQCPLVTITEQRWHDRTFNPDAVVLSTDGPKALLEAVNRVYSRKSSPIRRVK